MSAYSKAKAHGPIACAIALAIACMIGLLCASPAYAANDDSATGDLTVGTAATVVTIPTYGDNAINTNGKSNIRAIYRFGWVSGSNFTNTKTTTTNLDVTGDGWADKIKVTGTRTSSTSGYLKNVRVTVNGKTAISYKNSYYKINRAVVSVITLKNKKPFLWINALDGRGLAYQRLYQYTGKKFKLILSNEDVSKKRTSDEMISSIATNGNKLMITYNLTSTVTGNTKLKYTYNYSGGTLKRTSSTTSSVSYVTTKSGSYTKSKLTAAGTFNAYKSTSLKSKAFTVNRGKKVQILAAQLKGSKLFYKIKLGSKTGWIDCPYIEKQTSRAPSTLFYETYGKVTLKKAAAAYTYTKLYTTAELQKYNNHALYVMRNEIYARNGYTFTNGELRSRFMYRSWYSTVREPLNDIEQANASLILSIEKNRGSFYAA